MWLFVVSSSLFVVVGRASLFVVCCCLCRCRFCLSCVAARCFLLVVVVFVRGMLFDVRCLLFAMCCLFCAVVCYLIFLLLLGVGGLPFVVCRVFVGCCLSVVVECLLCVVGCSLFVV